MADNIFFTIALLIFGLGTIWSWVSMNKQAKRYMEFIDYQSKADSFIKTVKHLNAPKPYKLIVAGTYGQFQDWVHSHIFNFYAPQHLQGRSFDEIEFIKVGDWMSNPMIKELEARMTKEQWQEFLSDPVY